MTQEQKPKSLWGRLNRRYQNASKPHFWERFEQWFEAAPLKKKLMFIFGCILLVLYPLYYIFCVPTYPAR